MTTFIGLDEDTQDFFEITDAACRAYTREGMIFQYGSVRTMKIFSQNLSKSDFKELCRKALHRASKDDLVAIDWWNYVCKWVDDFSGKILSNATNTEEEVSTLNPNISNPENLVRNPFQAIDKATESR